MAVAQINTVGRKSEELFILRIAGMITAAPRGQGGFGYDPLFEIEGGKTFAELSEDEKNSVSHRAKAMAQLLEQLK